MDTMGRLVALIEERGLTLYKLAQVSGVRYSTLKNTKNRNGQLSVDTIEQICAGLQIPMAEFFAKELDHRDEQSIKKHSHAKAMGAS